MIPKPGFAFSDKMMLLTQAYASRQQLSALVCREPVPPQIVPDFLGWTNVPITVTIRLTHCPRLSYNRAHWTAAQASPPLPR